MLPTMIIACYLCILDIRTRRIPRLWILLALTLETIATLVYSIFIHSLTPLTMGWIAILLTIAISFIIAVISPQQSIGVGDATCAIILAQIVGNTGLISYILWLFFIGITGLVWILLWLIVKACMTYFNHPPKTMSQKLHNIPFVPPLTIATLAVVVLV